MKEGNEKMKEVMLNKEKKEEKNRLRKRDNGMEKKEWKGQ